MIIVLRHKQRIHTEQNDFSTKSTSAVIENVYQSAINLYLFSLFLIFLRSLLNISIFLFADRYYTILSISFIISNHISFSMPLLKYILVVVKISIGKFQIALLILNKDNFNKRIRSNQQKVIYHKNSSSYIEIYR